MNRLLKFVLSKQRIRVLFVYALIILSSSLLANIWMTRNQADGPAPLIVAEDLTGHSFSLAVTQHDDELLQDKPLLLYFFADWCPICKIQHPVISSISQDYEVISIAMSSGDSENVRKYVAEQNIDFRVINDENGKISQSFGVNGVPAAFVINRKGHIQFSTRGYALEAGLRSRIWLADKS